MVILPGVGHYLPAEVYPQIAGEVRALADRAASAPSQASTARATTAGAHIGTPAQRATPSWSRPHGGPAISTTGILLDMVTARS